MDNQEKRTVPQNFLLLKFGANVYTRDGKEDSFRFDDASADALIAEFNSRSRDLVIDFEHSTLSGNEAPAAGWIDRLEKTAEGLCAHVKYWTDKAKEYLNKGEYRYFSPTLLFGRGGKSPDALHSVALTNHPALHGVDALVANDTKLNPSDLSDRSDLSDKQGKETTMNQELKDALRKLLGESALALHDADDEKALGARIAALADELPVLRAKAAKCDELQAAETERRKLELFDRGLRRKAFCNAQKEALMKLPLEDLENLEKNTPDHTVLPPPLPQPAEAGRKPQAVLSPDEKKIAEKMGLSDEQFAETRKNCKSKEAE
jgi:phage I-like protein